jgi:hypothetical protein
MSGRFLSLEDALVASAMVGIRRSRTPTCRRRRARRRPPHAARASTGRKSRSDATPSGGDVNGGRCRTRTDGLFRVKEARYQLRQSPAGTHLATRRRALRRAVSYGLAPPAGMLKSFESPPGGMRMWRSGSASPCQGEGREFESRHPLEDQVSRSAVLAKCSDRTPGGVAERRGSGLQSRIHGFESRRHLGNTLRRRILGCTSRRAIGAAVARFPDTEEVTGSIPVSPTTRAPEFRGFSLVGAGRPRARALARPVR